MVLQKISFQIYLTKLSPKHLEMRINVEQVQDSRTKADCGCTKRRSFLDIITASRGELHLLLLYQPRLATGIAKFLNNLDANAVPKYFIAILINHFQSKDLALAWPSRVTPQRDTKDPLTKKQNLKQYDVSTMYKEIRRKKSHDL